MAEENTDATGSKAVLTRILGDEHQITGTVGVQYSESSKAVLILRNLEERIVLPDEASAEVQDDQIICLTSPDKDRDLQNGQAQWKLYYAAIELENGAPVNGKDEPSTYLRVLSFETTPPDFIISKYQVPKDAPLWAIKTIRSIISIKSGSEHAKAIYEHLVAPFLRLAVSSEPRNDENTLFTTSSTSVSEYTTSTILPTAQADEAQLIILLAGDGGIVDLVNTALSTPSPATPQSLRAPTIALLPCGTGNALANSTSIATLAPRTLGLRTLALGTAHPLPLLAVHFTPPAPPYHAPDAPGPAPAAVATAHAAVVVSWGLHAALVADSDTPAYRAHGAARFRLAAQENLFPADGSLPHAYRGHLALQLQQDDAWQPVQRAEHAYVLATLVAQLEAGFAVSPRAKPLDGVLRVVHFGPMPGGGQEVMQVMGGAYEGGKHVARVPAGEAGNVATATGSEVAYGAVQGMRIAFAEDDARWRRVCVDGKIFIVDKGGEIVVQASGERVADVLHVV